MTGMDGRGAPERLTELEVATETLHDIKSAPNPFSEP